MREVLDLTLAQAKQKLLEIVNTKAVFKGDFTLSSGQKSTYYIDGKFTSLTSDGLAFFAKVILEMIKDDRVGYIGGPTLGADPLASAVSMWSMLQDDPLDAFLIRKDAKGHGTSAAIEGLSNLGPDCPVVVLEDVVTTGGSTLRSVARCREAELDVLGVIVLVDRQEGGREAIGAEGLELISLFTRQDFVSVPDTGV